MHKTFTGRILSWVLLVFCFTFTAAGAEPSTQAVGKFQPASLFTEHAVLQQAVALPVWGTAQPGSVVTVKIAGQTASATTDSQGNWSLRLAPLNAGGPYEMSLSDGSSTLILGDILVGEVWICSGQSNMEWSVARAQNPEVEIAAANHPQIRLFNVRHNITAQPQSRTDSQWAVCSPANVSNFSAVGYFFAREIEQNRHVPVGMIETAWGGTPAESWTSIQALAAEPQLAPIAATIQKDIAEYPARLADYQAAYAREIKGLLEKWKAWEDPIIARDPGMQQGWAKSEFSTADWKTVEQPGKWEEPGLKNHRGMAWFRREIEIPQEWSGKELVLHLGGIDDADTAYFNGQQVGKTTRLDENHWIRPRDYTVPAQLVSGGRAVVSVCVFNYGNNGGFVGKAKELKLSLPENQSIELAGKWVYKVGTVMSEEEGKAMPQPLERPKDPLQYRAPTVLYNGMISPLIPYAIRGAIWYQGESNASKAYQYRTLFPTMIKDWRSRWNQGDFPFIWVQLAAFDKITPNPEDSDWAELREAQTMTLSLPNTAQAMAIDIGDTKSIHPLNKQEVGRRLALAARARVYQEPVEFSGPMFKSMSIEQNRIRLSFDHATGLTAQGGPLKHFAIAGEDRKFVWADAAIDGQTVVVSSPAVAKPVAVRYAWAMNPVGCNLFNAAGLPACPFRTDQWPGITVDKK